MSTPAPTESWRGVAAERSDHLSDEAGTQLRRRSLRLLGQLLRPHRSLALLLAVAMVVETVARLSVPWLVQRGIDHGVGPLRGGNAGPITMIVVAMLVAVVVQAVSRIWFLRTSGFIGQTLLRTLRQRLHRHVQRLDVSFHDRYTSGRVVSRLTNDVDAVAEVVDGGIDGLLNALLTLLGVGVMLLVLDLRLGAICLLSFPLLYLLMRWFTATSQRVYRRIRETSAVVIVQFVETMTGIRAVEAYRREPRNDEIFGEVADRYARTTLAAFRLNALFQPAVRFVGNLAIVAVIVLGGLMVIGGDVSVGVLAAFLLYLRMFFEPMQEITQFWNSFQSATAALEKISGVLEERPEVAEPEAPVALPRARGEVRFDGVSFAYTAGRPVIDDLTMTIPAAQTVALVGTTGAGKTTIVKLLARFYDPDAGRVLLDGVDLRELAEDDLRRAVVMVTQENVMFAGSVADNIRFGKPTATDDEVRAAARAVGADRFIEALPEQWETSVGARGGRLSAGQRQLVAFARAFLADPAVLILDEATSSLDIPSERQVQRALQTLLADRTAVIIAHRLSTVEIADRVLVLEHGRVLEDGSPAELVGRGDGRYAALHRAWEESLA